MQKRLQVTLATAVRSLADLGVHGRPVLAAIDGPVHAHRRRPVGALCEAGQREGRGRVGPGLVVHEQSVDTDVGDVETVVVLVSKRGRDKKAATTALRRLNDFAIPVHLVLQNKNSTRQVEQTAQTIAPEGQRDAS